MLRSLAPIDAGCIQIASATVAELAPVAGKLKGLKLSIGCYSLILLYFFNQKIQNNG